MTDTSKDIWAYKEEVYIVLVKRNAQLRGQLGTALIPPAAPVS